MSQAGELNVVNNNPDIPTSFITNSGTAVPVANELEILGTGVISTSASGNIITISASGVSETLTGNSGGAVSPTAGNINTVGTGSITIVGNPGSSTLTTELTGLTNHAVLVGAATATITSVGPSATSGQVLQSQGSSTDPAFSTATYPSTTTINQILYSSSANTVAGLATANNGTLITGTTGIPSFLANGTTGQVLTATTGSPPSWENPATSGTVTSVSVVSANGFAGTVANATTTPAITLSTTITGVLSGNGTAISGSAVTQYDVLVGGASNAIGSVGPGSAGQVLQSGGNAANPAYSTATYPSTTTINQILYSSSANVVGGISTSNNGVLITGTTGIPSMLTAGTTGQVLTATTGSPPSWANPATSGTVTTVSVVTANGFAGTVANATTTPAITLTTSQTGLLSGNGTSITGTAITQYNVLTAGASNAPNSVAPSATSGVPLISQGSSSQPVFGTAVVAGGGTGATSFSTNGVVISNTSGTGVLAALSLTSGQVVIGGTSTPAAATLTAGTGISISNGNNSITISSTGSEMTWTDEATSFNALAGNGYFITANATATLPASPSQGNRIEFAVDAATTTVTITANTGQVIRIGSAVSATAGTAANNARGDSVSLVFRSSDSAWIATSVIGTWTVT